MELIIRPEDREEFLALTKGLRLIFLRNGAFLFFSTVSTKSSNIPAPFGWKYFDEPKAVLESNFRVLPPSVAAAPRDTLFCDGKEGHPGGR
jgi:hypothetical protein